MAAPPPPESPATSARGFRYQIGFACTGPACPETCCGAWQIPVDDRCHQRLHETLTEPADRALLSRVLAPELASSRTPQRIATIELTDDGGCPFHDPDRLCSLQRRFGERLLPAGCATYPRIFGRVGGRLELSGALSCPEVARRALLDPDATDLVTIDLDAIDGFALSQGLRGGDGPAARLDLVREAMFRLLTTPDRSLDARLFALAHFGHQLDDLVAERGDPTQLARAIEAAIAPARLAELEQLFASAPDDDSFGLGCVLELLRTPLGGASLRLPLLVGELLDSFDGTTAAELWLQFVSRRDALPAARVARVDDGVARYAHHVVMTEWYTFSPRLRLHVMMLLLRIATLRFLWLGHPRAASDSDRDFDALGIELLYSFARAIERNHQALIAQLTLVDRALPTFAHAAPLLLIGGHPAAP